MRSLAACSLPVALAVVTFHFAGCAGPSVEADGSNSLAGRASCAACHEQEARFCRYGAHRTVECERCHGPGAAHARADGDSRPGMPLGDVDLCLSCHQRGSGSSSGAVSEIESFEDHLAELELAHRIRLDREKSGTDCVYCHDPHLLE